MQYHRHNTPLSQYQIKEQIDLDKHLGITCKVPLGVATECMITVPKKDGASRKTIDFQPINKCC